MKRGNEDAGRVIKIADPASVPMPVATSSAAVVMPAGPPSSTVAQNTLFAGRAGPNEIMTTEILQQQQQPTYTRVIAPGNPAQAGGVSVYRDSGSGPVAITTSAQLHPVSATTTVVTQPPSNIKPETISLPTAPVSVQYTTNFPTKTLQAGVSSAQAIVNTLTTQQNNAHQQQIVHNKEAHSSAAVFLRTPGGMRGVSTASLPTVPNPPPIVSQAGLNINAQPLVSPGAGTGRAAAASAVAGGNKLKVEDALSYLDLVKLKFENQPQPQVYNDFLDVMKEFKSQTIDTPGVIARVSCLFKGHPELIVGFNTFLPPGYKFEVQENIHGTNVGMNHGPAGTNLQTIVHTPQGVHTLGLQGNMTAINPSQLGVPANLSQMQSVAPPTVIRSLASITPTSNVSSQPMQISQPQQHPAVVATKYAPKAEQNLKPGQLPQQPAPGQILYPLTIHPTGQGVSGPNVAAAVAAAQAASNLAQVREQHHHLVNSVGPPVQIPQQQQQPLQPQQQSQHPAPPGAATNNQQPVEFNHAINYVNKIKARFSATPTVYKSFLEILHSYQKDQQAIKEGLAPTLLTLTEAEVYEKVSELFRDQEDLLSEFSLFLPEAGDPSGALAGGGGKTKKPSGQGQYRFADIAPPISSGSVKRPPSGVSHPPPKKMKVSSMRDVTLTEAGKHGTLNEYAFFDKVRKALRSPETYNNFLRILVLYNEEVVNREEVVQLSSTFLSKHPELFKWFKEFVGAKDTHPAPVSGRGGAGPQHSDQAGPMAPQPPRMSGDSAQEIDYATCKRLGASYCALPKTFVQPSCEGRITAPLCKEVLNDTWVSFPSWSEDSQFVTSRKTQYEECIYRTEDERFEFDVVLETNKDTIKVLECVQKKMTRMPPEEAARYKLDECLGGHSATIHGRAIRRIYGDKAGDIIDGLRRNPVVAVPLVLKRLKAKDEEWRDVQKNFNKVWREQNEKFYLKSLDHQALNFKQTDVRNLRSKSLLGDIEALYDERHEMEESNGRGVAPAAGSHLMLDYNDHHILLDANNLLIHHVKRQMGIHKEDKHKIKVLLRHFLLDCFKQPRQDLSDDEREDDDEDEKNEDDESDRETNGKATRAERARKKKDEKKDKEKEKANSKKDKEITEADVKHEINKSGRKTPLHAREMDADESYTHILGNNNWYLFFRLHNILCDRLNKMYIQSVIIAAEEAKDKTNRKESTAVALRLKPKSEVSPENYYPAYIDMVKNVLDGNMDATAYEDTLREMFGIHAYMSFTLDKVVSYAVRQLQNLVTDEAAVDCHELFTAETKNHATGGTCGTAYDRLIPELIYQKKAEKLLEEENCIKIFIYHQSQKMSMELLDAESESQNSEEQEGEAEKKNTYIERFINPGDTVSEACKIHLSKKPVFLPRGIREYNKSSNANAKVFNHLDGKVTDNSVKNNKKPNSMEDGDEGKSESDQGNDSESKENDSDAKDLAAAVNNGSVINEDNTQCQFKPGSMKMVYVIKSENVFYRRGAMTRAKKTHKMVSRRKFADFDRWHSAWADEHVADSAKAHMEDWFMGKCEGQVPNKTQRIVKNHQDQTPYKTYYKYKAEII